MAIFTKHILIPTSPDSHSPTPSSFPLLHRLPLR